MRKKLVGTLLIAAMTASTLAGCGSSSSSGSTDSQGSGSTVASTTAENTDGMSGAISVISREDGSGTRGAFIELTGVEEKNEAGEKVDNTVDTAEITNSTAVMMTTVAGNKSSKVARPFNIVTKDGLSETAQDFINFIMSDEGQEVVEENGYVSQGSTGAFDGGKVSGKITVAGSSSVTPVMEKLAEAYKAINSNVEIEVQQSDSTTGVTSAIEGICDIGMASRELKDEETSQGVTATVIAMDGIAIIVNKENPVSALTTQQVKDIYTGAVTDWSEVQ